MKLVVSHPTANQNVRAAVKGFVEAGIDTSFNTTIATFQGGLLNRLASFKSLSSLNRRCFDSSLRSVIRSWPWLEAGRLLALKAGVKRLTKHEAGLLSIDAVYRNLDKHVAERIMAERADAVYAYEDGALSTFQAAKAMAMRCCYDLPIGYWRAGRKMLETQKHEWPDWSSTLVGLQNSEEKLRRKDVEIYASDRIYVASTFTAATLKLFPGKLPEVRIIPYGFPPPPDSVTYRNANEGPLKVLFVGALTQRKGIANLFAAVNKFRAHVRLTVVGMKPHTKCVALEKELVKHNWIPTLSNEDVRRLMSTQDVLLFPSLFEGFGLVITEAMSQGIPVITTERTAGPDLIEHGVEGWLIEAGSTPAIESALDHLLSHRGAVKESGQAAMQRARKRPWEIYGRELAQSIVEGGFTSC